MIAHGFTVEQVSELVRARLATATPQRMIAGTSRYEVALRITDTGQGTGGGKTMRDARP